MPEADAESVSAVEQQPGPEDRREGYFRFLGLAVAVTSLATIVLAIVRGADAGSTIILGASVVLFVVLGMVALALDRGGVIWNVE